MEDGNKYTFTLNGQYSILDQLTIMPFMNLERIDILRRYSYAINFQISSTLSQMFDNCLRTKYIGNLKLDQSVLILYEVIKYQVISCIVKYITAQ